MFCERQRKAFEFHQLRKKNRFEFPNLSKTNYNLFILEKQKHNIERLTKTIERKTYLDCSQELSNLCIVKLRCRPGLLIVHQLITLLS